MPALQLSNKLSIILELRRKQTDCIFYMINKNTRKGFVKLFSFKLVLGPQISLDIISSEHFLRISRWLPLQYLRGQQILASGALCKLIYISTGNSMQRGMESLFHQKKRANCTERFTNSVIIRLNTSGQCNDIPLIKRTSSTSTPIPNKSRQETNRTNECTKNNDHPCSCPACFEQLIEDQANLEAENILLKHTVQDLQKCLVRSQHESHDTGTQTSQQDTACTAHISPGKPEFTTIPVIIGHSTKETLNEQAGPHLKSKPIKQLQPTKKNKLLIGSSIIQSVKPRGLLDTQVMTLRGAKILDVKRKMETMDITQYESVILQVGSNNCQSSATPEDIVSNYDILLNYIHDMSPSTEIVISGLCPRMDCISTDIKLSRVNVLLQDLAYYYSLAFVDNECQFRTHNGKPNREFLVGDGLHLSQKGTFRSSEHHQQVYSDSRKQSQFITNDYGKREMF